MRSTRPPSSSHHVTLIALATVACGSATAPSSHTPSAPSPPSADRGPACTAPAPAPSPAPSPAAELPNGRYWTRRPTHEAGGGNQGKGRSGEPGESWVALRTACVALALRGDPAHRTLAIAPTDAITAPPPGSPDGITFRLEHDPSLKGAWRLSEPRLVRTIPAVELTGRCSSVVTASALPIFHDRDECVAAPTTVTRRCRGGACRFDGAAPLWLEGCEDEVRRLSREVEPIVAATHDEQLRSLELLHRIERHGGRLWHVDEGDGACWPLSAAPGPAGHLELRDVHPLAGGGKVTYEASVVLEPLLRRARFASESRSSEGPSGGGSRATGYFVAGLFLGRDAVLIGDRWIFVDQGACRRHVGRP